MVAHCCHTDELHDKILRTVVGEEVHLHPSMSDTCAAGNEANACDACDTSDTCDTSAIDFSVNLGGIHMANPVNTASGTFAAAEPFEAFYNVAELGAITTKGAAIEAWPGNPAPRMCEVTSGVINSVGLQNPGVAGLLEQYGAYLTSLSQRGCKVICQVAGHAIDEYKAALLYFEEHAPFASGFEINISCPNIACGGVAMGATPQGAAEIVRALRPCTTRPLLIKMGAQRIAEIAKACESEGADALTLINSIPGMAINTHTYKSKISRPTGGMSGPAIHPIAVRMVWEAHNAVDIPICGVGGVTCGEDVAEFMLAGATAVSVGLANLYDPSSAHRILHEFKQWAQRQGVSTMSEIIGAVRC